MRYSCGCENTIDEPTGVIRCLVKCEGHKKALQDQPSGLDYYRMIGSLKKNEVAQVDTYVRELREGLPGLETVLRGGVALEIGCGVSPYVRWVQDLGYEYVGLDTSLEAMSWLADKFNVDTVTCDFIQFDPKNKFELIMMMHSLEHFSDAPAALLRAADLLKPGGKMIILVPDDQDPLNPDHQWFFTERTLSSLMERAGLRVLDANTRRVVQREKFIYALGEKL